MTKYRENFIGTKQECVAFLETMFPNLLSEQLFIEDEKVVLSDTEIMDYKIKFEVDEEGNYGAFGLKISWGEKPQKEEEELILQ